MLGSTPISVSDCCTIFAKRNAGHALSPIDLAKPPETRVAASAIVSSARCAYFAVVSGSSWPSSLPIVAKATFSRIAMDA